MFTLHSTCPHTAARRGTLDLAHGKVETPIFMPVGTQGTVKSVHPEELIQLGAQIILGNTYHLNLRPGTEVIREFGGLHGFSTWDRPILTDSGGYQVFSLGSLNKITPQGVHFKSHLDGAALFIGPEESMEIQSTLGSDIAMLFDECPPYPCERKYAEDSLDLTLAWAKRCRSFIDKNAPSASGNPTGTQHHFGIVQGSVYADLRERCARELTDMDFSGYAIGGVSVGEPEDEMMKAVDHSIPFLPQTKPRYAMGLGTPPQILEMISKGVDMFDCVLPTRLARHGTALTPDGPLNLKNARFRHDQSPLSETTAPSCQRFSRAYVHHLIRAKEILGMRILTLHNLAFYLDLVASARQHIAAGTFPEFKNEFTSRYLKKAS